MYTSQGTYTVNWTFNDGNGNSITVPQTVIVDDLTNPTLPTLTTATGECSASVTAPTTTDNCAGTITGTTTDPLTYSTQGTYTVNWTFNDGNGNSITVPQTVIVDDVTSPEADNNSLPTLFAVCQIDQLTSPTASDNCSDVVITNNVSLPITNQGTTVIVWTFTDANGNSSTQNQTVIIDDNTAPTPVNSVLAAVTATCEVNVLSAPNATDNCSNVITVTHNANLPITQIGTTTVTWTYDDGHGNTTTQTQDVIVSPFEATTSVVGVTMTASTGDSYQWINCTTNTAIGGQTNQSYTATSNGTYAVVVDNGNCSDTTDCVTITTIGLGENTAHSIAVYPNPTNGIVYIDLGENLPNQQYVIYTVDGKEVTKGNTNDQLFSIDLNEQSRGVYFLKLTNMSEVFEIVKN